MKVLPPGDWKIHLVTSNLIEKNGKFLLVQEGHKFAYGLWNFPAGKVEEQITFQENAIKEAKEETGFKVKIDGLVSIYHESYPERNAVVFIFASHILGGKLRDYKDEEILQAKWFTLEEIKKMKKQLRRKYILDAILSYKKNGVMPLKNLINSKKCK